ncbi:TonB-dependent receptor [Asticcacaulis sp. AND118]|uniref:TonB-dependent receptor n=1 Tax=Asticcacaulis sp. AND118 TaxID=2840468 RepID=UPI001CFF71A6|nr:TonB-dependent receptor [Asticcacaulis sp. AND118]UDF02857.1 TonB-dependent receptor [Asticcacaulis sp. AND118]
MTTRSKAMLTTALTAVLSGLMLTATAVTPAAAQETSAASEEIQEVEVVGIRKSLQSALRQKKNSNIIQEVVTAEDVGKFPDKNVADSLSRVTGVNVVTGSAAAGGFGENEKISIRGTDPELNLTLFNGHNLATGDWFVLDQMAGGRSFNYTMLPSEVVGRIDIIKAARADLPEGGVGGTVDVHTRYPLDLKPHTFNASLQGLYTTRADKWTPQVSGLYSWRNDDRTLGFLISAFDQEREFRRDGQEVLGYSEITNFNGTGQKVIAPNLIGNAYFTQNRKRSGVNFVGQYKPAENLEFTLSGLFSNMKADNINVNNMMWVSRMLGNNTGGAGNALQSYTIKDGYLTAANWANTGADGSLVQGMVQDDIFRKAHSETKSLNLDVKYDLSENVTLTGQIGRTTGEGVTDDTYAWETFWNTGASYELGSPVTKVNYSGLPTDTGSAAYLNNLYSWSWGGNITSADEESYAKGDLEYRFTGDSIFERFRTGVRFTDHDRTLTYNAYSWAGNGAGGAPLSAVWAGAKVPSDFFENLGGARQYALADAAKTLAYLNNNNGGRVFDFFANESYAVSEKTSAIYGMIDFGGEKWKGNAGVRVIKTEQDTTQYAPSAAGKQTSIFGNYDIVRVKRDYTDVLPSANLTYFATDELVLRAGVAKVISRPGFAKLAGSATLNELANTGTSGGNPYLDPFKATQFNATAEWYYTPEALLSLNLFKLDIDSYITTEQFTAFYVTPQTPQGKNFLMTGPANGNGGSNEGFELNWQQPLAYGFGFIANYTYADGKTASGAPIDGNSKTTYNLTGYYENDRVSARLAYNFRSKFKSGTDRGTDMWQDDISSLDTSVSVNLTDQVALTFDAQNLTEEKLYYFVGNPSIPRAVYDNGRTFYLGVRFKQ